MQVNKKMAAQALLQQAAEEAAPAETSNKKRKVLPSVLEDDRFKAMFEDPSFAVDEAAEEYKFHHPNAGEQDWAWSYCGLLLCCFGNLTVAVAAENLRVQSSAG